MEQFLKKSCVFFFVFYGLLLLLQYAVDSGLRQTYDDDHADWNRLFEGKISAPMVFLGSSRAESHFDTQIIAKKTGIPSYNLGLVGATITVQNIRWKSYIAHNKAPKIVIQNVDLYALSEKIVPDKKQFLPYYNETEMYNELAKSDNTVRLEKWIPMSKYRGYEVQVLKGLSGLFRKQFVTYKINGYHKHNARWNSDFDKFKTSLHGKQIDFSKTDFTTGLQSLQALISDCKKRNIKLILVWTPTYYEYSDLQEPTLSAMKLKIRKMANDNDILFWDYSVGGINNDKTYFYNSFHLNEKGVSIFCGQFSDSIITNLTSATPLFSGAKF